MHVPGVTRAAEDFVAVSARLLRPAEVPGRSRAGHGRHWRPPEMRYRFIWSGVVRGERGGEQGARTADLGGGGPEFTASGVPRETFWPGDLAFSPRWRPSPPSRSSHVNHGHKEIPDRQRSDSGGRTSGGECGAPRGRGGGIHGVKGASGGVPARGPGFSPDICPRAPPCPACSPPESLQHVPSSCPARPVVHVPGRDGGGGGGGLFWRRAASAGRGAWAEPCRSPRII